MVKLRLRRVGKKKQPIYKMVAADSRSSRSGKIIEAFGTYNPLKHPMMIEVNEDRLFKWLKRGAQPTDTLRSLLKRKGLWLKWSLLKKGADEPTIVMAMENWRSHLEEKEKRESERKARRKAAIKKKKMADAQTAPVTAPAPAETAAPAQ